MSKEAVEKRLATVEYVFHIMGLPFLGAMLAAEATLDDMRGHEMCGFAAMCSDQDRWLPLLVRDVPLEPLAACNRTRFVTHAQRHAGWPMFPMASGSESFTACLRGGRGLIPVERGSAGFAASCRRQLGRGSKCSSRGQHVHEALQKHFGHFRYDLERIQRIR